MIVVFDFDGVLVDSNPIKRDAYLRIFEPLGLSRSCILQQLECQADGNRYQVITDIVSHLQARGLLAPSPPAEGWVEHFASRYNDICENYAAVCPEITGASQALADLAPFARLFVNSATWEDPLRRVIARRKWTDRFAGVFGSPAPKIDNIRRIIESEHAVAANLVFIGDGWRDLSAAREAGCRFIGVRNEFNDFPTDGVEMIDDLTELLRLLQPVEDC